MTSGNPGRLLSTEATWTDIDGRPTVLVPVGSLEQHGPHLPLDTDTAVAVAVTHEVATRLEALGELVFVAPAVAYGASGEHQSFAGTISQGTESLRNTIVELGRSLRAWAGRVVFVNGHGGNRDALDLALDDLREEGDDAVWYPCFATGADPHAGRTETSLMLHIRPDSVRLDRAEAGNTESLAALLPRMRAGGVGAVSTNGVLGDPAGASADEGVALLAAMAERIFVELAPRPASTR